MGFFDDVGDFFKDIVVEIESIGGQCTDESAQKSKPKSLIELADKKLNQPIVYDGCVPDIGGGQPGSGLDRFKGGNSCGSNCYPNNGEFEWAGLGESCKMCSGVVSGYGCTCPTTSSVGGRKPTIKRIAYRGDPARCCASQELLDGEFTCDPAAQKQNGRVSDYCLNSEFQRCSKDLDLSLIHI